MCASKNIRYSQMDNSEGYVAPTIPAQGPAGIGFLTMLGWGNCVTIVPEMLYWQYGRRGAVQGTDGEDPRGVSGRLC